MPCCSLCPPSLSFLSTCLWISSHCLLPASPFSLAAPYYLLLCLYILKEPPSPCFLNFLGCGAKQQGRWSVSGTESCLRNLGFESPLRLSCCYLWWFLCPSMHYASARDDVHIAVRCRCVLSKYKPRWTFSIPLFPEAWQRASCPLPPMTQCPSAPKHSPTPWLSRPTALCLQLWHNDTSYHRPCFPKTYTELMRPRSFPSFLHSARLPKYNRSKTGFIIGSENWVGIWSESEFQT